MKKALKWVGIVVGVLLGIVVVLAIGVFFVSNARINKTYEISVAPLDIPSDAAALEAGKHISVIRGCIDCHGEDLTGARRQFEEAIAEFNFTIRGGQTPEEVWVEGLALRPDDFRILEYYYTYGLALAKQGICEEAIQIFEAIGFFGS